MRWSRFVRARAACAYFFVGPGLAYGLFTSRLPAMKAQTGANEAEIGLILLVFGASGLAGLLLSTPLIRRFSSRKVLRLSSFLILFFLPILGLAPTPLLLALGGVCVGLCIGLMDVSMNTQAIQLEQRYAAPCMALMHAGYSMGGVVGALASAAFASFAVAPFWNFAIVFAVYALARPWSVPRLQKDIIGNGKKEDGEGKKKRGFALPPVFVLLCGLVAACCYSAEGTVGEWGALYLNSVKGADEGISALVYASFSISVVVCRMFADMARTHFDEFWLMLVGSFLAVLGMSLVLFTDSVALCLVGYGCVGFGMAPIVPFLFSRAGSHPGVDPSTASAVVSVLAYAGLLMFPPVIGTVAHAYGLHNALLIALFLTCLLVAGSFLFKKPAKKA